jgi:hypothetical protein
VGSIPTALTTKRSTTLLSLIGGAFIRRGRASVRQAICMPALVAIRFNPDMKVKYNQLIDAGKPAKIALTAVMRKLILLANTLLKAQQTLDLKSRSQAARVA